LGNVSNGGGAGAVFQEPDAVEVSLPPIRDLNPRIELGEAFWAEREPGPVLVDLELVDHKAILWEFLPTVITSVVERAKDSHQNISS
jgi:hypothetical protein